MRASFAFSFCKKLSASILIPLCSAPFHSVKSFVISAASLKSPMLLKSLSLNSSFVIILPISFIVLSISLNLFAVSLTIGKLIISSLILPALSYLLLRIIQNSLIPNSSRLKLCISHSLTLTLMPACILFCPIPLTSVSMQNSNISTGIFAMPLKPPSLPTVSVSQDTFKSSMMTLKPLIPILLKLKPTTLILIRKSAILLP